MARDYFDESKKKKTTTQKAATKTKSQSSSVAKPKATTSKATKAASKSTFLGGGASTQKVQQTNKKPSTVKKPATTKKTVTQQERINQKMYGSTTAPERRTKAPASNAQRKANAEANLNLKQTVAQTSRTRLAETETQRRAAQTQKMTAGIDAAKSRRQTQEIGNEIRRSVKDSLSADNRAFAQRQKSGTLTEEDKRKVEQREQRRAQIAKNTGVVAKKAIKDTGSGYAQTLYDLTELTTSNKNGTQAKAMKMGIDPNKDKSRMAELERQQKYTAEESKRRRDELFKKQEQRQAEWDERTKNAKGLEKAWYGAVESGTGMLADTAVGAVTGTGQFGALASMGLRTYGPSANQARKEGATDKEARLYGLAQSAKEVGTELMFQGAGLAKAAYGKTGLSLADKSANVLTRGLTGIKADAVGAGVRALGGAAEENVEELAGWVADPLIKELTYGKAVRNRMKENLRSNIPQIGSGADAANVASYFSTPKFTDDLTKEYVKSGMSQDKASALAAEMRDYYVAYYSGDQGKVDALEEDLAAKLSGQDKLSFKSWSMDELKDTLASTTLLTLATGIPGAVNTSVKGNQIFDSDEVKAVFGNDAVRKVADAVKNTSNREMSLKAEVMKQRLDSGKDLTGTQKYDLYQGYIEKVNETSKKARASYGVVENAREEQDLVPTMGMDRAGNTVYAKETQKEYNEKFASTELTVEAIKNYMESDNSISDDESRRANAVKKAVADLHVGGLTVGDVHEFAYGNELAREALKAEEGIDLNRYIVRDSNGNVDLAATNEATENALFEINAANAIKAAQAETEVYIDDTRGNIDKDLLTRFGNNGQAVWKEVNKDLDPRDLKNYLTTANAASYFYSAGRNTDMSVDEAINRYADTFKTVDNSVLEKAFAAGAEDRIIANTPGYGQTVESGSNIQLKKTEPIVTGQLIMDDDVVIPDSDQSAYLALAMSTNSNIHIVGNLNAMGKDGKPIINQATGLPVQLNGMSHGNDIYLNMNASAEQNLGYVFMHEMTHQIKQYAPNEYLALENLVRDKWFNKDATGMQAAIKQRMDLYSVKGGQQLTEEEAVEEIIADAMAEAMDDPNFAAEVCEQDINLGQQILDGIRAALRSIRQIFANSDYKNDRFHNSLLSYLGILDEAEKMWLNALATAKQNKADGLIADWQDKANKQNAPRLSVTEVSDEEHEGRYSITPQQDADINDLDKTNSIVENDNGDPVAQFEDNGSVSFSISSYEAEGRKIYKDYLDKLVNDKELSQEEADQMLSELETIYDISKRFADSGRFEPYTAWSYADVVTDAKGKPVFSSIRKNSEYKMNIDFSTICKKRRTLDAVFREMIRRGMFEKLDLNKDESAAMVVNINNLIRKNKFEAACALCFVEARRYRQQQTAKTFTNMWNELVESMYSDKDKIAYFNFGRDEQVQDVPDGIHTMDDSQLDLSHVRAVAEELNDKGKPKQTAEAKAARLILNNPEQRKLMRVGDMMASTGFENMHVENPELEKVYNSKKGTGGAKSSFGDVQYLNEIINSKTFDRQKAYDVSGVRIQSFSDYVPRMVFDYVQVIADLAAKKLPAHAYTKEVLFVLQFGLTGAKVNMSLVPDVVADGIAPGLDKDGNYAWNAEGTFPWEDYTDEKGRKWPGARSIQKAKGYKENCGTIAVGISDKQIMKMLADPEIQMVIPYHKSSLNPIVAAMTNVDRFTNYEDFQNTKNAEGKAVKTDFAWDKKLFGLTHYTRGEKKGELKPRDKWGDVQGLVKEYVDWCESKNYTPKFSQFLYLKENNDPDGDFVLDEDGNKIINPGYYKMLEDFALMDNDGNFKPQGDVHMQFPTAETGIDGMSMESLIERGLTDDTELEAMRSEKIGGIVDEIDNMFNDGTLTEQSVASQKLAQKFSISPEMDDAYMDAVESDDMTEAQKLVDDAARMAGFDTPLLHHGTPSFGFTTFDLARGENIIFATNSRLTAETYSGETSRNRISEKSKVDVDQLYGQGLLDKAKQHLSRYKDYRLMSGSEKEDLLDEARSDMASIANDVVGGFIAEHRDAFDEEKLGIANRIVDSLNKISTAWNDDDVQTAWDDFQDAIWDLKWVDESIQLELSREIQSGGALQFLKNRISDFMYAGDLYARGDSTSEYVYDNQLALELGAELNKGIYGLYGNPGKQLVIDANGSNWNQIIPPDELGLYGPQRTRSIAEAAKAKGYDSVLFKDLRDNGGATAYNGESDVYMFFNPNQVKSADPVTYAEDGSVIPLSERFDPTNNDIRYSMPTQDSDGKILTDGQMEYFKNSQARDEQGRLVPVYHTTNYGGFTIFDPSYSDDKRSLFFASNWNVSQTYGRNANKPIDIYNDINSASTNTLIDRVNNTTAWNIDRVATEDDFENEIKRVTLSDDDAKKYGLSKDRVEKSKEYVRTLKNMLERMRSGEDFFYSEYNSIGHSYGANSLIATKQEVIDLIQSYGKGTQGYYSCYLNLENPLIVDAHGANWNKIPYGEPTWNPTREKTLKKMESEAAFIVEHIESEWEDFDDNFDGGWFRGLSLEITGKKRKEDGTFEDWSVSEHFTVNEDELAEYDDYASAILSNKFANYLTDELGWSFDYYEEIANHANDANGDIDFTPAFDNQEKAPDYITSDGYKMDYAEIFDEFAEEDAFLFDPYEGLEVGTYRTRELAEMAQNEGYDGVIIRNCRDIGGVSYLAKGSNPISDIFIAFSSNQVKDVANENPTENPDIRYSITDEDEAMSHMAHDYAYDTSYEALAYYEDLIAADASTEATYEKAKNYIAKDVDEFYAGLTRYADGMKFDDPVLEEGRTRMARSKQDYFNSNVAKWNDAWLTDGEVLDTKSIRKAVRDLVMANMMDSDTDRKYKTELVDKMLIDMRLAYFYAKQGRTDVADALLWHSAFRMVDGVGFYNDDGNYETYKKLRDYFKDARLRLGEEYWNDTDYAAFRKRNYGKLNLVKGETNIDKIFGDLYEVKEDGSLGGIAPEFFTPEAFEQNDHKFGSVPDTLLQIEDVLLDLEPYAKAYSSEYCAEWATDIASDLLNIMQNGKELQSIADRYTNKYEARIKAMKARHAEAMLKVRQQRDEGIKREKAKLKEYKEHQKEKRAHNKSFESIQKTHKKLTERLLTNTADKNIPEQYKRDLARLLAAFDLQTVGSKKYEMRTGRQGQKTIKMAALKTALTNIENKSHEFHVSDAITDIIDELLGKDAGNGYGRSIEGLTIDELSASELDRIDKLLKALLHEFNTYRNVKVGAKRQQTEDIGKAQVDSALEHAKMFGAGKDYQNIPGGIDRIINLDEVTPAYMFKHIDPEKSGLGLMFKELRRSFDKYVKNQEQLNEWMDDIVGKYHKRSKLPWKKYGAGELENWRSENYAQTFNLENGPVTLTPAQMMSLYCLSKRTQAYNHMTGAGIVVAPVSFNAKIMSDLKKKPNTALPVKLTDADIKQIVAQLTPDQIKVAEDLQQLMADRMAAWGNEASMNVLGIELFGEPDYFPIKSDKAALEKDLNENEFVEAIRNFGFTKAVQPGARNAIMVDDIFNVVTEHCNNMNLYNAYSEAINDFMKVYNYRDFRDDGSEYTVQQAIAHAYGSKATTFIMTFMRDLNGNVSGRASGIENLYNSLLGNAKKAAVFANLRVAAQQPTAITRAFAVIDPKYLKGIKIENGAMDELFEHCPIALWKSWGYYDINMGKSIEDIMMNNGRWLEDAATELYGALDNVTWTAIWQMVKAEMKDTHPDVKVGSDEYWELCNERMTEVVDLTQVVDSPFHRSHAMRDKGIFIKAATSFMAEPTLTFNMLRDGVIRSREAWKKGDKAEAAKIAARIGAVALLQAATVAGAASLVDALRKKRPDKDDEDERFLHLWWVNALENFRDELKVWNKIYFVKDIASIFDGWDNSNLALQGIQKFALGYRQLTGDPYARSSATWYENMADGIGYMTGVPVKTVRTGLKNAMTMLGVSVSALDSVGEKLDSVSLKNEDGETGMIGKLLGLVLSDDGDSLLDKYAEKKGYKKVEKSDEDVVSEKTSESGEAEETEKREQLDYDTMLNKALKAAEGYEGEEYNQRIYSSVAQGMKGYIADGDYVSIGMMRTVIEQAGGDVNYFDQRVMEETKSAYKKSLNYDMSYEERWDQKAMYRYMMQHGMSQEELSSEVLYKSDLAKDMKVAYRIGDNDTIYEAMLPLVDAGITETDLERLYENRNRMDLTKYKQNGRFKDKLKSMGTFIWPTDGVITSHFGYRNAPTAGASSNHPAIDIGAPQGTAVVAADGGVIIYAGTNSGYGNSVGIKHDNGMVTYYNHLYAYNVNVGDTVAQGQQIAQVGSTGISTGPHLDFKILDKNGKPVDPEKYLGK